MTTTTLVVGFVLGVWHLPGVEATTTTNPQPIHIHLSPGVKAGIGLGIGLGITATVILSIWCCCIGPWHWSRGRRRREAQFRAQAQGPGQAQGYSPRFNGCQVDENGDGNRIEGKEGSEVDLEARDVSMLGGKQTGPGAIVSEMPVGPDVRIIRDGRSAEGLESEIQVGVPPPAYRR